MNFIATALGAYLVMTGAVFLMQRSLLYPGARDVPEIARFAGLGIEPVTTTTDDGLELTHWYLAPKAPEAPVIVVFHGNAGHLGDRVPKLMPLIQAGFGMLFAGYRGYSGNPGSPTEEHLSADARGLLAWLEARGVGRERTVFYGESLGTGVAVKMAVERPPAAIILEAPYTSIAEVAQAHYWFLPARWLVLDRWDSLSRIGQVAAPLLVLHGERDRTVPLRFGKALFEAANHPKDMLVVTDGGHVDLFDHREVVERVIGFLRQHQAAPDPNVVKEIQTISRP